MYFWNTKALAHELSSNTLDKKHYKNYYLVTALLVSVVYYYGMYSPYGDVRVIGVEGLLTLLIMFIGIPSTTQVAGDASVYQIKFKLKKKMPVKSKTDRHTFENNIFFKLKWYAL